MTDTVSCQNCNTELPANAAFCTNCGTKVVAPAEVPAAGTAPVEADAASSGSPTVSADDETRIDTPGLQDATQVLPKSPPVQAAPPMDATQVIGGSDPAAWTPPPPPPQAPWQPPSPMAPQPLAPQPAASPPGAPQPGAWQPPPPPQPDWAQPTPPTTGQGWAAPTTPTAPPSQWQPPPTSPWAPGGATPTATAPSGAGKATTSAGAAAALAFLGAVLLVAGVFGLWLQNAKGASVKLTGWEMVTKKDKAGPFKTPDPAILLGIAAASIAVGGVLIAGRNKAFMRVLLALASVGSVVVLVRDYFSIKDAVKHNFPTGVIIDFKYGFWVAAAGAVVLLVAAVVPSRKHS